MKRIGYEVSGVRYEYEYEVCSYINRFPAMHPVPDT